MDFLISDIFRFHGQHHDVVGYDPWMFFENGLAGRSGKRPSNQLSGVLAIASIAASVAYLPIEILPWTLREVPELIRSASIKLNNGHSLHRRPERHVISHRTISLGRPGHRQSRQANVALALAALSS